VTPADLRTPEYSAAEALQTAANSHGQPFLDAVLRALGRLQLSEKELAALMKLSPSQWSQQKSGANYHHLSIQRLDILPDAQRDRFLDALLDELAHARGRIIATPQGHLKHIADAMASISKAVEELSATQPVLTPLEVPRG
jgi:hypothetical protein